MRITRSATPPLLLVVLAATLWCVVSGNTGRGVMSIYFRQANFTVSGVSYLSGGYTWRNVSVSDWPGPSQDYRHYQWLQLAGSNASVQFLDSNGNSNGVTYGIVSPGVFVINATANSFVQVATYATGCPELSTGMYSEPLMCSRNGVCNTSSMECECYSGYTGLACAGSAMCQLKGGVRAVAKSTQVIKHIYSADDCCSLISASPQALQGNYIYDQHLCELVLSSEGTVLDFNSAVALITQPSRFVTPSPPTPAPDSGGFDPTNYYIGLGCVVAVAAVIVVLVLVRTRQVKLSKLLKKQMTTTYASRYRPERLLGKGAFGAVYLARKVAHGGLAPNSKQYALKVIVCGSDEDMLRAWQEFTAVRKLHTHRGIATMVDMFLSWAKVSCPDMPRSRSWDEPHSPMSADDRPPSASPSNRSNDPLLSVPRYLCIVMEYYPGGTLADLIADDPAFLTEEVVVSFAGQLLDALHHSHNNGILHRDLKPANVLLCNERRTVVITDFGLARSIEGTASLAAGGGTLMYFAPEQLDNSSSSKSDVWGVGCLLLNMGRACLPKRKCGPVFAERLQPDFEEVVARDLSEWSTPMVRLTIAMLAQEPFNRPSVSQALQQITHISQQQQNCVNITIV